MGLPIYITEWVKYNTDSYRTVTLELQKKVGNGYQKLTNVLSEVNGVTKHTQGVFDVNASNGTNTIPISLSLIAEKGTYRLMFKVLDNSSNTLLEVPYNFIIIKWWISGFWGHLPSTFVVKKYGHLLKT